MKQLIYFIIIFTFSSSVFAKLTCKKIKGDIESLNDKQGFYSLKSKDGKPSERYESLMSSYLMYQKIIGFIDEAKGLSDKELDKLDLTKYRDVIWALSEECIGSDGNGNLFTSLNESCKKEFKKNINDEKYVKKKQDRFDEVKKNIDKIQSTEKFKQYALLKKALSLRYMEEGCLKNDDKEKLTRNELEYYACNNSFYQSHTDSMKDFSKDNLDVLLALQVKINSVSDEEISKACMALNSSPEFEYQKLKSCKSRSFAKKIQNNGGSGSKVVEGNNPATNPDQYNFEGKGSGNSTNPKTGEMRAETLRRLASEKAIKKDKNRRFWKTTGVVAAAIGGTGLLTYGLYKLFEPVAKSNYTLPEASATSKVKTYQTYQMNPYNQYMYNQYMYQMPYMNSNYGSSWMGYQNFDSSPYTFEYGF